VNKDWSVLRHSLFASNVTVDSSVSQIKSLLGPEKSLFLAKKYRDSLSSEFGCKSLQRSGLLLFALPSTQFGFSLLNSLLAGNL
jgi:hypothetical protein